MAVCRLGSLSRLHSKLLSRRIGRPHSKGVKTCNSDAFEVLYADMKIDMIDPDPELCIERLL